MVFNNLDAPLIFKKMWSSKCTPRIKFFAWLMLADRLNTRSMLLRHHYNVQPNAFCVLCDRDIEQDILHLYIFIVSLLPPVGKSLMFAGLQNLIYASNCYIPLEDRHSCSLWKFFLLPHRKSGILETQKYLIMAPPSINLWARNFKSQGYLQLVRVKDDHQSFFSAFLETVS